jgi:glutamate racemase
LIEALERLAPWPVTFIDPAPAIARRLDVLLGEVPSGAAPRHTGAVIFTSGARRAAACKKPCFGTD